MHRSEGGYQLQGRPPAFRHERSCAPSPAPLHAAHRPSYTHPIVARLIAGLDHSNSRAHMHDAPTSATAPHRCSHAWPPCARRAVQIFAALQYVVEEKFVKHYRVPASLAVGLEGFWGLVLSCVLLPLFQHLPVRTSPPPPPLPPLQSPSLRCIQCPPDAPSRRCRATPCVAAPGAALPWRPTFAHVPSSGHARRAGPARRSPHHRKRDTSTGVLSGDLLSAAGCTSREVSPVLCVLPVLRLYRWDRRDLDSRHRYAACRPQPRQTQLGPVCVCAARGDDTHAGAPA